MAIPVQNIYYLLCYAWNKLDEKDRVKISIDDNTSLLDLFAKVLINATGLLLKRGIDKQYQSFDEEVVGIKGKLLLNQTVKANLFKHGRAICQFDDLTSNSLLNQILVTTIHKLRRTKGVAKELKRHLSDLEDMMFGIEQIELSGSHFKQIKLNRNNRFYGFVMNVCQIIYESTLPSERPGEYVFADFTRDERKMNQLFESFIRNFYRLEQRKFPKVDRETIYWQFDSSDSDTHKFLPQMKTDITLENDDEKIIIDAKYYQETMVVNYEKERIRSNNLYQLYSYLLNQEKIELPKTLNARGILLYPTIEKEFDLKYKHRNHGVEIRTVNLDADWRVIANRLVEIIS